MKATVLVDNIGNEAAHGEWGLAIYIEYEDKRILLDVGSSGLFAENAEKLGIDLSTVDFAVLSHIKMLLSISERLQRNIAISKRFL